MGRLVLSVLQAAHLAGLRPAWRRFQRAASDPSREQSARLKEILAANAGTAYGREFGFAGIRSAGEFQDRVPVTDYDQLAPWVERIARGETGVLTSEPVRMMEYSGGSTSPNKLVPYTRGLLAEFAAATSPWLYDLHRSCKGLWGTRSYWSISPVSRKREATAGGLPIGMADDTEYFDNPVTRWALRRMLAVPAGVARLPDIAEWRQATLGHLLEAGDLGLISVWSPTFLTQLMRALAADYEPLLSKLSPSRAREIRTAVEKAGKITGPGIWPWLALISCWTDGSAKDFLPDLERWFPGVPVQGKGLLATEGVVSFPIWGARGAVAAVSGHFLEFLDLERPERPARMASELREGASYSPLLTTSGGLYRYHLADEVTCVGRYRQAPLLSFVGKLDRVSDLCGEKLNARQVDRALEIARTETGLRFRFALLAPVVSGEGGPPHYRLFLESDSDPRIVEEAARKIDECLLAGHPYRYCRQLGQLGPLRVQRVNDGWAVYERTLACLGQKTGDIKPTHLDNRRIWQEAFADGAVPDPVQPSGKNDGRPSSVRSTRPGGSPPTSSRSEER